MRRLFVWLLGFLALTAPAAALVYHGPDTASVGTASGSLVAAGVYSYKLQICTLNGSSSNVWLNVHGGTAVVQTGVPVWAGGGCTNFGTDALPMPQSAINAITDSGSAQTVTLAGG